MEENTVKTAEKQQAPGVPFTKDDPRINRNGRPKGSEDFKTKWFKFIDKVAKSNNMTPEEIDEQLLAVGFKKAKEGDYAFYRDIHDRVYGKPLQSVDLKGDIVVNEGLSKEQQEQLLSLLNDQTSTQ